MLRTIVLTHGGAEALIDRLKQIEGVDVAAVFVERPERPRRTLVTKIRRSLKYEGVYSTLRKFASAAASQSNGQSTLDAIADKQRDLAAFAREQDLPLYEVENFHSESSIGLMRELEPDLAVLYGTNIIREEVFGIPRLGTINLHQGFAPLYRGGPTVFWELFNGEEELGITVHFVVSKVDAGDIIVQKRIPLDYDFAVHGLEFEEFLAKYRRSLKRPSIELIGEAVELIANGRVEAVKQDLSVGKRYRLPTKREKDALRRRLRQRWEQVETK